MCGKRQLSCNWVDKSLISVLKVAPVIVVINNDNDNNNHEDLLTVSPLESGSSSIIQNRTII